MDSALVAESMQPDEAYRGGQNNNKNLFAVNVLSQNGSTEKAPEAGPGSRLSPGPRPRAQGPGPRPKGPGPRPGTPLFLKT